MTVFLYFCMTVLLCDCMTVFLYFVWLCDCVTVGLYDCISVFLFDCVTVWLCDCVTTWTCQLSAHLQYNWMQKEPKGEIFKIAGEVLAESWLQIYAIFKREHLCKTVIKGVQDWGETEISVLLEKLCINRGSIRFKDVGLFIIFISRLLVPQIVLLLPRLPDKEKFLYSGWNHGSHLSYEICCSLLAYLYPEKLSKICGAVFWVTP